MTELNQVKAEAIAAGKRILDLKAAMHTVLASVQHKEPVALDVAIDTVLDECGIWDPCIVEECTTVDDAKRCLVGAIFAYPQIVAQLNAEIRKAASLVAEFNAALIPHMHNVMVSNK